LASQKIARRGRKRLSNAFGLVNQEVVIELVNEDPTQEMVTARERFWERVFLELLPAEESSVKAKLKKQ
jgi:hypothetical protein